MEIKKLIVFMSLSLLTTWNFAQDVNLPHLEHKGNRTQIIVDGKPFLMLGGELHNSTAGSAHYIAPIWKKMADKNLNTVIATVSWELFEPVEGQYEYDLVDSIIEGARKENLKLVLIWFGSWKNTESTYAPEWVKKDGKRFPRTKTSEGAVLNMLSPMGENTMRADAKAYAALMRHIKEVDSRDHTVVMMQVENELGMFNMRKFGSTKGNDSQRDFSEAANKAFKGQVPAELMAYLKAHKNELHPQLQKVWKANGNKEKGTWEEVFGKGEPKPDFERGSTEWQTTFPYYTEELFSAWNYAKYVGEVTRQGKAEYPIPMYVNAWLKQETGAEPGKYPSGAPFAHLFDVWRAAAPEVDFFAPDIYIVEHFDFVAKDFTSSGNPLFIPETKVDPSAAARAFYAYGKYDALCYSPFGIDGNWYFNNADANDNSIELAYGVLKHIMPDILKYQYTDQMTGLFIDKSKPTDKVDMGKYTISIMRSSTQGAENLFGMTMEEVKQSDVAAGLLIIQTGEDEFLAAGGIGGLSIKISKSPKSKAANISYASVDKITYDANGNELRHRLNGDETSFSEGTIPAGQVGIFRIKMFEY
ncbi:MAG: DUF5597 domain-containing protein [Bacteroidaceae bacterium]|nr:DUF5597 domain-containing protein [Bacteroidaceae bacterium]